MTSKEFENILDKIREIQTRVQVLESLVKRVTCQEATLFDNVEDLSAENAKPAPVETAEIAEDKPKTIRRTFKDGTMTASSIAFRLSKETGKSITKESVTKIAESINALSVYDKTSHTRRYSPESVDMIFSVFRQLQRI